MQAKNQKQQRNCYNTISDVKKTENRFFSQPIIDLPKPVF